MLSTDKIVELWAAVCWPIICLYAAYLKIDPIVICGCLTYLPTLRWIKGKEE